MTETRLVNFMLSEPEEIYELEKVAIIDTIKEFQEKTKKLNRDKINPLVIFDKIMAQNKTGYENNGNGNGKISDNFSSKVNTNESITSGTINSNCTNSADDTNGAADATYCNDAADDHGDSNGRDIDLFSDKEKIPGPTTNEYDCFMEIMNRSSCTLIESPDYDNPRIENAYVVEPYHNYEEQKNNSQFESREINQIDLTKVSEIIGTLNKCEPHSAKLRSAGIQFRESLVNLYNACQEIQNYKRQTETKVPIHQNNRIKMLKHNQDIELLSSFTKFLIYGENQNAVLFIDKVLGLSKSKPLLVAMLNAAAFYGNFDIVGFLINNGIFPSNRTFQIAYSRNKVNVTEFLHIATKTKPTRKVIIAAIKNAQSSILKILYLRYRVKFCYADLELALSCGALNCAKVILLVTNHEKWNQKAQDLFNSFDGPVKKYIEPNNLTVLSNWDGILCYSDYPERLDSMKDFTGVGEYFRKYKVTSHSEFVEEKVKFKTSLIEENSNSGLTYKLKIEREGTSK